MGCQRSGGGNKVTAIMKSQARAQTEVLQLYMCVTVCIHPLMHSGPLWAHLSEINIKPAKPPVGYGWVGVVQGGTCNQTHCKRVTFHLSSLPRGRLARTGTSDGTCPRGKQYHYFNCALINGLAQISCCLPRQRHMGRPSVSSLREEFKDGCLHQGSCVFN